MANIIDMIVRGERNLIYDAHWLNQDDLEEVEVLVEILSNLVNAEHLNNNMTVMNIEELKPFTRRLSQLLSIHFRNHSRVLGS